MDKLSLLRMRYAGVLKLLEEASPYVPEEIREAIEAAHEDACADGTFRRRRDLNRCVIEVV